MADTKLSALTEESTPALADYLYAIDAVPNSYKVSASRLLGQFNSICDGRLTLTSGVPVTNTDVLSSTNIYFTPYTGQCVSLYDGTRWRLYAFTELTLALSGLTASLTYDVFLYDNAGTLTLEALAWTSLTLRATALARQNGVLVKSGAPTRRYLGTFIATSTTQTLDSVLFRFLWNAYNQVPRLLSYFDGTGHTYNGGYRAWNNDINARVQFVLGLGEQAVPVGLSVQGNAGGPEYCIIGACYDSSTNAEFTMFLGNSPVFGGGAYWSYLIPLGYHYLYAVESTASSGVSTFSSVSIKGSFLG